jgi:periplasmic divalent cation tolerance protein
MHTFVELVLTCGSWQEAQKIVDALLEQKLIACAEFIEIKSRFQWHGKTDQSDEIKLIMTTIADHFDTIEVKVRELHSYDTFVLQQIPITHLNPAASQWLQDSTQA